MIKAIQIPFYNKIQAAKPALNPYASIKHQPPRHSELVSESIQPVTTYKITKNQKIDD